MRRNGRCQRRPPAGGRPVREQTARNGSQLRPELLGGGGQVDADAHHQKVNAAALEVGDSLGEDAADLFAAVKQVVHPFDRQRTAGQLLHGPAHGHGGGPSGGQCVRGGHVRPKKQREVHAARRADEGAAQAAAALFLPPGHHQRTAGGTGQPKPLGGHVGGVDLLMNLHQADGAAGGQCGAHRLFGEGVIALGQPVALAACPLNGVAAVLQLPGGLPDGGATYAQLLCQRLPAEGAAAARGQCLKQRLLGAAMLAHGLASFLRTCSVNSVQYSGQRVDGQ